MHTPRTKSVEDTDQESRERDLHRVAHLATERFFETPVRSVLAIRLVENGIFEVVADDGTRYALRIHRHGHRTERQIEAELEWMAHLAAAGTTIAGPVAGRDGQLVQPVWDPVNGVHRLCSLLSWIDGFQLDRLPPEQGLPMLGEALAKLHVASTSFTPSVGFDRPVWNIDGIIGPAAVLGDYRAIDLTADERRLFDLGADVIAGTLLHYGTTRDRFGMIHGDGVENNAMFEDGHCVIIDFDDSGWGWYVHDLATVRYRSAYVLESPEWTDLLLSGYVRERQLTDEDLLVAPALLAARALSLVGWLDGRSDQAALHRDRCVATATRQCRRLIESVGARA